MIKIRKPVNIKKGFEFDKLISSELTEFMEEI